MWSFLSCTTGIFQLYDKTNKMNCAPSEDSDQPGHLPSLIRVFAVRMKKLWVLSYPLSAQRRLWSDWADAQTGRTCHAVGFVMRRLNFEKDNWHLALDMPCLYFSMCRCLSDPEDKNLCWRICIRLPRWTRGKYQNRSRGLKRGSASFGPFVVS